jgi:imidazolonepropionase-like amidohydrolase
VISLHWLEGGELIRARREQDVIMSTPTGATPRPRLLAIHAAWLSDGAGSEVTGDPLVVLDGAPIVSVQQGVKPPEGADLVDLGDATLMPGLIDTHVHLAFDSSVDPVGTLVARTDEQALAAAREAALVALPRGVTTARDLGDRNYLTLGLRDEPGLPTILSAGPPITTPGGHCYFLGGATDAPRRVSGSAWNGVSTSSRSWPAAAR